MKKQEKIEGFLKRIRSDYVYRTFFTSTFSFFASAAFMVYNLYLGIAFQTGWNVGIAIYYALLMSVRAYVGYKEIKFHRSALSEEQREQKRKNVFLLQSVLLFIVDFALIAPITQMALQQKTVNYSEISAIAVAAYTVYKTITSSRNFVKTRKYQNLSVKIFKNINFIDALVSVLTLQYTLIMTFGTGVDGQMRTLCAVTNFSVWVFLIVISVLSMVQAVRIKRANAIVK